LLKALGLPVLVAAGLGLALACSKAPEDPYRLASSPTPNLDVDVIMTADIARATQMSGFELTPRPSGSGRLEVPCTGRLVHNCRIPHPEVSRAYNDKTVCDAPGRKVCLVPLGAVSLPLTQYLVSYYQETYGLTVQVLPPLNVPELANPRGDQTDVSMMRANMSSRYPRNDDWETILIGLTPLDIYEADRPSLRFLFGQRFAFDHADEKLTLEAIVSTFRMEAAVYSQPGTRDLTFQRVRKMVNKYVALAYYGLPLSKDPFSATYDGIGSLDDLDLMSDDIPGF
jgi:predicted Zn-dependent protease